MSPSDRAALNEALIDTTLTLVRIPSVTREERVIADHVERRVTERVGAERVTRIGHSLVVEAFPHRADLPTVALLGHLDTVPSEHDGPARVEGDRIYGCGVSDMKAGLAVKLELLDRLEADQVWCNLLLVFYEREEGPFDENGLKDVLDAHERLRTADLAFCLEPSSNRLQLGSLGGLHCTLTFDGKKAHSARPWQGENAIHRAGPVLSDLLALDRKPISFGPFTFYEVMNATMVTGGGTRNVIPDSFAVNVNYRFAPGRTIEAAQEEFTRFIDGRCTIEWTDLSPSGPVCLDNRLLKSLLDDDSVVHEPKQAWTDVARLGLYGIDSVNLGPGESAQAHQRNEYCATELIIEGYELFERYLTRG
jgi:succinyl-diaminopimelate desuccinylase